MEELKGPCAAVLVAAAVLALVAGAVLAGGRSGDTVTAKSHYGNGTVTGAVRRAPYGWQVRFPGGWWEDCEGDCAEALRRKHLDFWRTLDDEAGDADSQ